MMRIILMGSPAFALPSLELIREKGHHLIAVITRPDRPRGRRGEIVNTPVKEWALKHQVTIFQPAKVRDKAFLRNIQELNPELIVTAAYGFILPGELLRLPIWGSINVHASLLPAYRGAAPIHRAIMDGALETGVTIMRMTSEVDAGDIILQQREPIYLSDTMGSLHDRLAEKGARLLLKALDSLVDGSVVYLPQDHRISSYAAPLQPDEEQLDWRRGAADLYNQIRGMNPWPGAYTFYSGKRLKIWRAEPAGAVGDFAARPGSVTKIYGPAALVSTGEGTLAVLEVQPQGKRIMSAGDFCRGCRIGAGLVLGG